jgi:hypothetical protein
MSTIFFLTCSIILITMGMAMVMGAGFLMDRRAKWSEPQKWVAGPFVMCWGFIKMFQGVIVFLMV